VHRRSSDVLELLELIELLPEMLEIGSAATKYRENEVNAQLRLEAFARVTLAQHQTEPGRPI